ncbi:MAG TPA: ATP-binding protein [Acidisarcina sp.]
MTITPQTAPGSEPLRKKQDSPLSWPNTLQQPRQGNNEDGSYHGSREEHGPEEPNRIGPGQLAQEQLAHDARNLLATMGLYCDLLAQPGVLNRRYAHYAGHLKVVVDSGISLVGRLARPFSGSRGDTFAPKVSAMPPPVGPGLHGAKQAPARATLTRLSDPGSEIERRRGMLSVLLGPRIVFDVECLPCPGFIRLEPVDLGRILVNLLRNAGEAMPEGGRVRITLQQSPGLSILPEGQPGILPRVLHELAPAGTFTPAHEVEGRVEARCQGTPENRPRHRPEGRSGQQNGDYVQDAGRTILLCVQDNGPGIAPEILTSIFDTGFSTRRSGTPGGPDMDEKSADNGVSSLNGTTEAQAYGEDEGQPGKKHSGPQNFDLQNSGVQNFSRQHSGPPPVSRGLGLGIVRSLVEAAGGQIRVVSRPGAGTRFEMEFPLLTDTGAAMKGARERPFKALPSANATPGPRSVPLEAVAAAHLPAGAPREEAAASAPRDEIAAETTAGNRAPAMPTVTSLTNEADTQEGSRVQC